MENDCKTTVHQTATPLGSSNIKLTMEIYKAKEQ
jgi:hypothetical protein